MGVQHAHQRGSLSGEILQAQQRDTGQLLCAHRRLDLLPIGQAGNLSRRLHLFFPLFIGNSGRFHPLLHQPQVGRIRNPLKSLQLMEVRKHLELSHLKAEYGFGVDLPNFSHGFVVVLCSIRITVVDIPLKRAVLSAACMGSPQIPGKGIPGRILSRDVFLRGKKVALRIHAHIPVVGVGTVGIQTGRIQFMGKRQHAVHPGVSHRSGRQLISKGQHHEGRMICQSQNHLLQFRQIIGVAFRRFKGVHRIPVGQLRLHQHAHPVRRNERRLRRAVGMETHAVDSIGTVPRKHIHPFLHRHGRMAGLREFAAVGFTAQKDHPAV